ncbi:hypothetical protein CVIRNUC_007728 [Coccomyxa viridis]|uniref:Sjoegren syndrome nuclear autoantigen 1 n=1 Tax=Coccomyxa viridis TaxID=1274662 RepID=A0AAV1IBW4_9CHLO|nr:hypothetical protein CVIRNUC_007728 [Coccomyxa viridis]
MGPAKADRNMELLRCMDHLQSQRLEVAKAIKEEEAEKTRIEQDMAVLQSRLAHIKESLQKKVAAQAEYDRVLEETQTAYDRIVQSSEALLDILQRECSALGSTEQQRGQLTAC